MAANFYVTNVVDVANDDASIVKALKKQPLNVYIRSNEDFHHYASGIIENPEVCNGQPNHAVIMTGFDSDSYTFRNPWGETWGEK